MRVGLGLRPGASGFAEGVDLLSALEWSQESLLRLVPWAGNAASPGHQGWKSREG